MTLFTPILGGQHLKYHKPLSVELLFLKAHALLFTGQSTQQYEVCVQQLLNGLFEKLIIRTGTKFKETGVLIAICGAAALFEYGVSRAKGGSRSIIRLAVDEDRLQRENAKSQSIETKQATMQPLAPTVEPLTLEEFECSRNAIAHACTITFGIFRIALSRPSDKNVDPMIHTYLVLVWHMCRIEKAIKHLERDIPWSELVSWLNTHATIETMTSRVTQESWSKPGNGVVEMPLPEHYPMRGQPWTEDYPGCNENEISDAAIDDDERVLELPSMTAPRQERMLHLGYGIASYNKWITYDDVSKKFSETRYVKELRPRESKTSLQAISLQLEGDIDSVMSGMTEVEDISCSLSDSPSQQPASPNILASEHETELPKKVVLTKAPTILKRVPKEDVDMVDTKLVKEEGASSPAKSINYESEDWLKGQETRTRHLLSKGDQNVYVKQSEADDIRVQHLSGLDKSR